MIAGSWAIGPPGRRPPRSGRNPRAGVSWLRLPSVFDASNSSPEDHLTADCPTPLRRPLRFRPIGRDYVWGGCRLRSKYGGLIDGDHLAEVWLLSGHASGMTEVADGPLRGMTPSSLLERFGSDFAGTACGPAFPWLLKLLDVEQWLSVQVHPGTDAPGSGETLGKTEMWIALDAFPDARLLLGMRPDTSLEQLAAAGPTRNLPRLLRCIGIEKGQAFFVPAGTPHALGPGPTVLEVQASSDTTYRLYDWDREEEAKRPRPLHWREGLQALKPANPKAGRIRPVQTEWQGQPAELLADCDDFQVLRISLDAGQGLSGATSSRTMSALIVLDGALRIGCGDRPAPLDAWESVLLPAAMGSFTILPTAPSQIAVVELPGTDRS